MTEVITAHDVQVTPEAKSQVKKKPRALTPARREQNRQAQRVYRQRQKELKEKAKVEKANPSLASITRRPRELAPQPQSRGDGNHGAGCREAKNAICDTLSHHSSRETLNMTTPLAPSRSGSDESGHSAPGVVLQVSPDSSLCHSPPSHEGLGSQHLPDPHASNIRLMQTTLTLATLHNARRMGFDLARVAACGADYISPFYRPDADLRTDPQSLFAPTDITKSLPPNLRPTLAQILVPHHVGLDLIPIPMLRDRAILLSVTKPDKVDLLDLKMDIFQRGGLMVWCSPAQRGDNILDDSWECEALEAKDWVPWNWRCWEAAPWFLRKWAIAVDGDEGELGRQSRWWKTVREAREAKVVHESGFAVNDIA